MEIAYIHDADTEIKKKNLFSKVNDGQVRILLGSTQKMGAGTNVQERLIAIHHLDVGWRPADMIQRNGGLSAKEIGIRLYKSIIMLLREHSIRTYGKRLKTSKNLFRRL